MAGSGRRTLAPLLPEHLRLPDLSGVRSVREDDLSRWRATASAAIAWGPDERNGCIRHVTSECTFWLGPDGRLLGPDEWTPSFCDSNNAEWTVEGSRHRRDQPDALTPGAVLWRPHHRHHRTHAPASFTSDGEHAWWWANQWPGGPVSALLTAAWADPDLDDQGALALLDEATIVRPRRGLPVRPQTWLAHVIAAHPSPNLSPSTRSWCALVTA